MSCIKSLPSGFTASTQRRILLLPTRNNELNVVADNEVDASDISTYCKESTQFAVAHVSCMTSSISLSPSEEGGGAGMSSPWYTNTNYK